MKNPITQMLERRRLTARRRKLEETLTPDPEHRKRRLAQMSPERAARYKRNIEDIGMMK